MPEISRRKAMSMLAVTIGGAALVPRAALGAGAAVVDADDVCFITPETTEGPFYVDPSLVRMDITDGRPGMPTKLRLQVVDERCQPVVDARVDVWHCDARGAYSGVAAETANLNFLRGTQVTDAAGRVEFLTIYPGWYPGRTPHIHLKVWIDQTTVLTGQMFFPDIVSDEVYTTLPPYNERGPQTSPRNDGDAIARQAGERAMADVHQLPEQFLITLTIGVEPPAPFGGMAAPPTAA